MASEQDYGTGKIKLSFSKTMNILRPYVNNRFMEQVKGVWFIILYLILFQIVILQLPIVYSLMIAVGVFIVIVGLMFFMEGLMLGLMPFAEIIGASLPKKSKLSLLKQVMLRSIPYLPAIKFLKYNIEVERQRSSISLQEIDA